MDTQTLLLAEISQNIKAVATAISPDAYDIAYTRVNNPPSPPDNVGDALSNLDDFTEGMAGIIQGIGYNATTGNTMINTDTDITGATLQVAGDFVISDGAGGEKTRTTYISVTDIGSTPKTLRTVAANLELWLIQLVGMYATSNQHGAILVAGGSTASIYKIAGQANLVIGSPTGWQIGLTVSGSDIQASMGSSWGANTTTAKISIIRSIWT
jgi:hypothetical protein